MNTKGKLRVTFEHKGTVKVYIWTQRESYGLYLNTKGKLRVIFEHKGKVKVYIWTQRRVTVYIWAQRDG